MVPLPWVRACLSSLPFSFTACLAALTLVSPACDRGASPPCQGYCGAGTRCVAEQCIPEAQVEEAAPEPETSREKKRKKRGSRRDRGAGQEAKFVPVDDSNVPRHQPNRDQVLDMKGGTERLGDRDVTRHMRGLEPTFNNCLATAASFSDEDLGGGSIEFQLNVEPSGKVSGVDVAAPKNLRVYGIVPCLRKAVHSSRFPTWDGPPMDVEYRFRVE